MSSSGDHSSETTPLLQVPAGGAAAKQDKPGERRSWATIGDMISPFSGTALASLPDRATLAQRAEDAQQGKSVRTDNIPDVGTSAVQNYQSISGGLPPGVRVPKKIATPIKVESKVWFANERTWISYTNVAVILASMATALYHSSRDDVSRYFGYTYGAISLVILFYGYFIYQHRVTMIRQRDPGHFDQVLGPVVIAVLLFVAIAANWYIRWKQFGERTPAPTSLPPP